LREYERKNHNDRFAKFEADPLKDMIAREMELELEVPTS